MRRSVILPILGLQCFALLLVILGMYAGVHTDEAKYLLGIPYPHPPILRSILALTRSWPAQDLLWRFVFATLTVHAVWIVWDLALVLPRMRRIVLAAAWLTAAPVILQAGSVMLVVPTAIFGLLILRLSIDRGEVSRASAGSIALLWFFALGSAYQTILYAPLVWSALRRARPSRASMYAFFFLPIVVLALYTITNPLAVASMMHVAVQDGVLQPIQRLANILWVWTLAGGALTVFGCFGAIVGRQMSLGVSLLLVLAFIALSGQQYYAILLVPLLVGGVLQLACQRRLPVAVFFITHLMSTIVLLTLTLPGVLHRGIDVRGVVRFLHAQGIQGPVLIDGPFGHEWQYWSPFPVLRLSPTLSVAVEDAADAMVCTRRESCAPSIDLDKWERATGAPLEIWVKKRSRA